MGTRCSKLGPGWATSNGTRPKRLSRIYRRISTWSTPPKGMVLRR
ncbi:hypothetical protein FOMG_17241 [Fusarium oxysporum f. sp. melonis 26406]|uniref:Uncharacterized protein n=1 Tax=Fusarium oxysporum f. sp. melonis 26406 TaxID=1089452 RepID=W9Z332_FUSOX|nr:hypothetical protein FOMG_17241 [Fusarium oxysporum f. sp. melonis 26406]